MQLGITTIQRDRGPWIKEWIAFHYLVGFRKFYIYPHVCIDNTVEVLEKLKKRFDITIFYLDPNLELAQLKCYQHSVENYLKDVDWMAFIDGDEFLFPTACESMETALEEFNDKKISALGVYWACFGSSGCINEPSGLIIENYRQRADFNFDANRHIKSIVRGAKVASSVQVGGNAHIFQTPLGTFDGNLRPVTAGLEPLDPTYNKFRINHYVTQSRSHFLNFKKTNVEIFKEVVKPESWWVEHNRNEIFDNSMDRFIGPLKKLLDSI